MSLATAPAESPSPTDRRPPVTLTEYARGYLARLAGGDMGSLPAVLGLVVLCAVFTILHDRFLTAGNFANLFLQGAQVTVIAMGLVFVLLVGEIDLSAGVTSGVCGAVLAVLLTWQDWPALFAVPVALVTGVVIGTVLGTLVAKVGIPSFVVTLAAFLAFQGVLLMIIRGGEQIPVNNEVILALLNETLPPWLGWAFAFVCVAGFAAVALVGHYNRSRRGLIVPPLEVVLLRIGVLAVVLGGAVFVLNLERSRNPALISLKGVPVVVPVIAALLVIGTFLLDRTQFGRHLYAVGGNREAARRAGIDVVRVRVLAFVICSSTAALAGILVVSRDNSVHAESGGSNVLLLAVGAAVIGGTSLFGGKGRLVNAVIGGAVVAVIDNGMGLLGFSAGTKYVVTGLVLLLAAGVDALTRRRAVATGTR
ncbi:MAG TPA: ABC transporter permease [Natronosporangium sp.]